MPAAKSITVAGTSGINLAGFSIEEKPALIQHPARSAQELVTITDLHSKGLKPLDPKSPVMHV